MPVDKVNDLLDLIRQAQPKIEDVARAIRFYRSRYFFAEPLVKYLLWGEDLTALPRTQFIDYSAWARYYPGAPFEQEWHRRGERRTVALPYTREIDLAAEPDTMIHVESLSRYEMGTDLLKRTESNLTKYRAAKPTTSDGPVLRLAGIDQIRTDQYVCRLERSTYWMQARTNLTLDLPLEEDSLSTLRTLDLGPGGVLRPLQESLLLNSIGVSAVVYQTTPMGRQIFLKKRRDREGVFENMLGTASGVVTIPAGLKIRELVSYATAEMMREFSRETGLEPERVPIKEITPLAFCRELSRGGKPQFFFAIEVPEIDPATFGRMFKLSPEGLDEFADHLLSGIVDYHQTMSPEFATNLALAFEHFQRREKLGIAPLELE